MSFIFISGLIFFHILQVQKYELVKQFYHYRIINIVTNMYSRRNNAIHNFEDCSNHCSIAEYSLAFSARGVKRVHLQGTSAIFEYQAYPGIVDF